MDDEHSPSKYLVVVFTHDAPRDRRTSAISAFKSPRDNIADLLDAALRVGICSLMTVRVWGWGLFVVGWFGGRVGCGVALDVWRRLMLVMLIFVITTVYNYFTIFLMDQVVDCHRC